MTDITVIIVTWNCKQYVIDCLQSIFKDPIHCSMSITVVDNNSSDNTVEQIEKDFPAIRIIANSSNKGFATANNQGIKDSSSRYVLLLNPDTIVHSGAFDRMVSFLDSNETIAAIGPAIVNGDGSPQWTGVRFPSNWNILSESFFLDRIFPRSRIFARHKSQFEDFTKPFPVDYVQGSCLMIRRSVLDIIGVLDKSYFMYFEETDLCYRIKNAGHQVYFFPGSSITHYGGGEEGHFTETRLLQYHISLFQFYRKNYPLIDLTILKFIIFIRSIVRILTWIVMYLFRPGIRIRSKSIIIGYLKTFKLLVTKVK